MVYCLCFRVGLSLVCMVRVRVGFMVSICFNISVRV